MEANYESDPNIRITNENRYKATLLYIICEIGKESKGNLKNETIEKLVFLSLRGGTTKQSRPKGDGRDFLWFFR